MYIYIYVRTYIYIYMYIHDVWVHIAAATNGLKSAQQVTKGS